MLGAAETMESESKMIELQHIDKTFTGKEASVEALKDVSLSVRKGEIFGIIGYSGAGKSTLVRIINLLEKSTAGSVAVDGQELTALNNRKLRRVRRNIGMVFQHFSLLPSRNVFDNIAFPLKYSGKNKAEIARKVNELLKLVELADKAAAYPSQLSGGQKQRVAIARALAADPKVLLCDEATSALDPQTTLSILKLIKRVNRQLGITVVIITHEMAVIKEICDRVAVMENGRIVEMGDVFDVFSQPAQAITQKFIDTTTTLHRIHDLIFQQSQVVALKEGELLLKLQYAQRSVSTPLVSFVSRTYGIDLNILFGSIEMIGDSHLGGMVVIASGDRGKIEQALAYLKSIHIGIEVLKGV